MGDIYRMILADAERDLIENGRDIERYTGRLAELKEEKRRIERLIAEVKEEIEKREGAD